MQLDMVKAPHRWPWPPSCGEKSPYTSKSLAWHLANEIHLEPEIKQEIPPACGLRRCESRAVSSLLRRDEMSITEPFEKVVSTMMVPDAEKRGYLQICPIRLVRAVCHSSLACLRERASYAMSPQRPRNVDEWTLGL
jgi:hypothetical protein